ncbi:hypothetical protein MSAN_02418600 [Mycena sanguinolenta]|uniref:Uncharacterized protein n=1 Tax=Mycena sanguinolenta TaxID=230812 RepID=A0A8H7CEL2_9AGAR|nr:hypothetical protein MSAN_02418600 [Mycena sanguinolenta]
MQSLEPLLPALATMQPQRLALIREPRLDPHTPLFAFLTHLHLFTDPLREPNHTALPSFLAQLPALTRFAMGVIVFHTGIATLAKDILVQSKSLQALILVVDGDVKRFPSIDHDDMRFILHQYAGHENFIHGWVAETRGRDRLLGSCRCIYCQEEARGDSAKFPLLD